MVRAGVFVGSPCVNDGVVGEQLNVTGFKIHVETDVRGMGDLFEEVQSFQHDTLKPGGVSVSRCRTEIVTMIKGPKLPSAVATRNNGDPTGHATGLFGAEVQRYGFEEPCGEIRPSLLQLVPYRDGARDT